MVAVISEVDTVIWAHSYSVGPRVDAFAPGAEEVSVLIEDDHGVLTTVKHVNVILGVDTSSSALFE